MLGARQVEHFADGLVGRDGDRVVDDAALVLLDAQHLAAWDSAVMFLWITPMPPSWASAIARRASVTVSMAADTMRQLEGISARQLGAQADVARQDLRVGGLEEDVVEGEGFLDQSHRGPSGLVNPPFYARVRRG
jgi:hypothetical protein